jgi:mono/diheme cytochrome c family protein
MKRSFAWIPLLLSLAGSVVLGAQATLSIEDHPKIMKANAQAAGAMNKAIGSGAYADARKEVATLRQNFTSLQAFWMDRKKDDAVAIVKDGLARLDTLDKLLAAPTVDQMAAQAGAKEFAGNTCGACHKLYREGDAQTGFRFKPGVL